MYPIIIGNLKQEIAEFYNKLLKKYPIGKPTHYSQDGIIINDFHPLGKLSIKLEDRMLTLLPQREWLVLGRGSWFAHQDKKPMAWHQDGLAFTPKGSPTHFLIAAYPSPTEIVKKLHPYGAKPIRQIYDNKEICIPDCGDVALCSMKSVHRGSDLDKGKPHLVLRVFLKAND